MYNHNFFLKLAVRTIPVSFYDYIGFVVKGFIEVILVIFGGKTCFTRNKLKF